MRKINLLFLVACLFVPAASAGARISPLHRRSPTSIRAEALAEAKALEAERVRLV